MLIRRVTQTLQEIKTKKRHGGHVESAPSETTTATSDSTTAAERPKTRRREEPQESPERFRTSPVATVADADVEGEFELLQAKLNTIIENSEPDESAKSETSKRSDPPGAPLATSCTNTDRPAVTDRTMQTSPWGEPVRSRPFEEVHTQTDADACRTVAVTTSDKAQQADHRPRILVKSENLSVQILPEVSIPRTLQVEQLLSLYIDEDGDTHVLKQSAQPHVGYFEVRTPNPDRQPLLSITPTLLRVRGALVEEKEYEETAWIRRPRTSVNHSIASGHADMSTWSLKSFPMESLSAWKEEAQRKTSEEGAIPKQVPRPAQRTRLPIVRSHSDTEINLETISYSKEEVLRSYQVVPNLSSHDPGGLDIPASNVLLRTIDPEFFQTYINPGGVQVLKSQVSMHHPHHKKENGAATSRTTLNKLSGPSEATEGILGLFASKGVQCDCSAESSSSDDKYEKYTFSISCSTDSSNEQQRQPQEVQRREDKQPSRRSTLNQDNVKKLKLIRDKLAKEHPEEASNRQSLIQQMQEEDDAEKTGTTCTPVEPDDGADQPIVKDFICGLMSYGSEELQKVVPLIRGMVHSGKSKMSGGEGSMASPDKDKDFTVNILAPLYGDMGDVVNPLRLSRNGRYADEKNLFCRHDSPKGDCNRVRNDKYKVFPRWNGIMDSSFSSSITSTDKSMSEGEVTCKYSISNGEVHPCTRTFSGTFQKNCKNGKIQKKRTYFSNLVTYYINKDGFALNDSTSSSNK